jgi:formate dehydrogenase subunit gamma
LKRRKAARLETRRSSMKWTARTVAVTVALTLVALGFFIWGIIAVNPWAIAIPAVLFILGAITGFIWLVDLVIKSGFFKTKKFEGEEVERFNLRARWLHWTVAVICLVLALTGVFLFANDWWGIVAMGGYTRVIHRFFAVSLVAVPLIYLISFPKTAWAYVKESFSYSLEDLGWLKVAPDYYFGGDESKMPPQGHINPGQRLWCLCTIVCGILLVITGAILWFFKGMVPPTVFQWTLFTHDLAFIGGTCFFIVHFILGALHPTMSESLRSMWTGKISVKYAKSHYGKWYDQVTKGDQPAE